MAHKPLRSQRISTACSICSARRYHQEGRGEFSHQYTALQRLGGLDASFVNIPRSNFLLSEAGVNNNNTLERNDIESVLLDGSGGRSDIVNGADMEEAGRRMDAFVESTMAILSEGAGEAAQQHLYCQSCLER